MPPTPDSPGPVVDPATLAYRPCVGAMILDVRGHVWVGRRIDAPGDPEGRGTWWQMPQGGIDEGEDPAVAVLREVAEETGIVSVTVEREIGRSYLYDLPPELIGKTWGGRYRGQRQHWFALRFTGADDEVNLTPPGHKPEFDTWRWAPASELVDLIVPFKREVYRAVLADAARLGLV
jgi:putative (di)nucleoside polyphosphate hydrolase